MANAIGTTRARSAAPAAVPLYTPGEVAERLDCSENHVYRLITTGVLRAVDIALPGARRSKTRVRDDDLAAYIDSRTAVGA
jgi:excisionase family DNA binding protein